MHPLITYPSLLVYARMHACKHERGSDTAHLNTGPAWYISGHANITIRPEYRHRAFMRYAIANVPVLHAAACAKLGPKQASAVIAGPRKLA